MQRSILARLGYLGGANLLFPDDSAGALSAPRPFRNQDSEAAAENADPAGPDTAGNSAGTAAHPRDGPREPSPTRRRWAAIAVVLFVLLFFGLREHWLQGRFRWAEFGASFAELRWQWILAALACSLAAYFGRALRWRVMLEPLRPSVRVWGVFKATAIGFSAVVLLGRPGEFVRPYLISLKERVPFSSQLAAWLLERICDLLAVALVFGFAISRIWSSRAALGPTFRWVLEAGGWVVMALSLVCLTLLIMMGRFSGVLRRRLLGALNVLPRRFHDRAERAVAAFMDGTASTTSPGSVWLLMLYTAVEWLLVAACFACMFRAYSATEAFTAIDVLIFMGFIAFGSVLQIPGVGGGLQLVSIVVLTQIFGLTIEVATSIAIMAWLITFVAILPIGLWFAFQEGLNWRRFRDLERFAIREAADA